MTEPTTEDRARALNANLRTAPEVLRVEIIGRALVAEHEAATRASGIDAPRFDHDGTFPHHHDADTADPVWWQNVDNLGEKREHRHHHRPAARAAGIDAERITHETWTLADLRHWMRHDPQWARDTVDRLAGLLTEWADVWAAGANIARSGLYEESRLILAAEKEAEHD